MTKVTVRGLLGMTALGVALLAPTFAGAQERGEHRWRRGGDRSQRMSNYERDDRENAARRQAGHWYNDPNDNRRNVEKDKALLTTVSRGARYADYRFKDDRRAKGAYERNRAEIYSRKWFDLWGVRYARREDRRRGVTYYYFVRQR